MITAEKLQFLTSMNKTELAQTLNVSGYTGASFKSVKFLGMTNGGEFCYQVTYYDDAGEGDTVDKVFVNYKHAAESITASY